MTQIAVVGGGVGGLMTAYLLGQNCKELCRVTVFEASERVGGKILTQRFNSASVIYEAGVAELYDYSRIGPDPLKDMVTQFGLAPVKMWGRTVVLGNSVLRNRMEIRHHLGVRALKDIDKFYRRARSLVRPQNYYMAHWYDGNGHPWLRQSFHSLLAEVTSERARRFLKVTVHSDLATEPHLTNALSGLENLLIDDPRYVQLYSIQGGIERLPQALRERLSANIELNRPVIRIEKARSNRYRVYYRNLARIEFRDFDLVAVALPNDWLATIEWGGKRLEAAMHSHQIFHHKSAHYLRITILFERPFWRKLIRDSYFILDAFGGCCVYDEGARYNVRPYGVLSWLLGGSHALLMSNEKDSQLIEEALESLPEALVEGRKLFLEGHVHRWVGSVSGQPGGDPEKDQKARHLPEPIEHPGLFVVGDYLFDSTINGVLDSADVVAELVLTSVMKRHYQSPSTGSAALRSRRRGRVGSDALTVKKRVDRDSLARLGRRDNRVSGSLRKAYFDYYDGERSYSDSFKEYFDAQYTTDIIKTIWGAQPPYRLLDSGSGNGLTLAEFAGLGVDAWGIENSKYIHDLTSQQWRHKNILGDVRQLPFEDSFFDFVYETCLCYVPDKDIELSIRELQRVTRRGLFFGAITTDMTRRVIEKHDLFYGVKTFGTLWEWSEQFLRNGFRLAVTERKVLDAAWKIETEANEGDDPWYSQPASMMYCFYTKATVPHKDR